MKRIVITGSSRGIGYGLADEFLALGCKVMISGRTQASVDAAMSRLGEKHGLERVSGCPCDVTKLGQIQDLWLAAKKEMDQVDIWINNAGGGHALLPMWELPVEVIDRVIDANVKGVLYGSRVAIQGMIEQGFGQLYNMLGHGARGNTRDGMSVYGMSKSAVNHLSEALISETEGTNIKVGTLSPGMVVTDMLLDPLRKDPQSFERAKRIFNILSDRVETVTPWLAKKVLEDHKSGTHIRWLTPPKIMWRFLTSPINKRELFDEITV